MSWLLLCTEFRVYDFNEYMLDVLFWCFLCRVVAQDNAGAKRFRPCCYVLSNSIPLHQQNNNQSYDTCMARSYMTQLTVSKSVVPVCIYCRVGVMWEGLYISPEEIGNAVPRNRQRGSSFVYTRRRVQKNRYQSIWYCPTSLPKGGGHTWQRVPSSEKLIQAEPDRLVANGHG